MSLYGALFAGVSGLSAQSSAMGAIADNVTNVNTIGYKGTDVNFQTLVTKQVSSSQYSAGGVQSKPRAGIDQQGLLQSSSSTTDVAISGEGMFIVNSAANPLQGNLFSYTRAGSFKVDSEGYLQNVGGSYLQGWPLQPYDNSANAVQVTVGNDIYMKSYKDGVGGTHYVNDNIVSPQELKPLNLNTLGGTSEQTRNIRMGANLPASALPGDNYKTNILTYDSLGEPHNFQLTWKNISTNNWSLEVMPPEGSTNMVLQDSNNGVYAATGRIDMSTTPQVNDTIDIGANAATGVPTTYTFVNGSPANSTQISLDTPSVGTTADITQRLVNAIQLTESGALPTAVPTQAVPFPTAAAIPDSITVTNDISLKATKIDIGGLGPAAIVAAINAQTNRTGVTASLVGGFLQLANSSLTDTVTVTSSDAATMPTLTTMGLPEPAALGVSGGGADTALGTVANPVTSTNAPQIIISTAASATAPASTTTVNLDSCNNIDDIIGKINAQTATTNIRAVNNSGTIGLINVGGSLATITDGLQTPMAANLGFVSPVFLNPGTTGANRYIANASTLEVRQTPGGSDIPVGIPQLAPPRVPWTPQAAVNADSNIAATHGAFNITALSWLPAPATAEPAISFNGNGTPSTINVSKIAVNWCNGATNVSAATGLPPKDTRISTFFGNTNVSDGMTQFSGAYQTNYISQNGAAFGNFAGVSIGKNGIVTALFDNGVTRPVFQIPLATFVNANALESLTGNSWIQTDGSGTPTLRTPGSAGAGETNSASLESSTVDLGAQFTTMITTQRAYSASAKIITTADQMLDELVNIKR
ncbi:MAG: flagellar hook-basal body complex protein [Alphaproteobacteria bacterium]